MRLGIRRAKMSYKDVLRERADTLGRVSYVPDFDVSSGHGEDEARGVPDTKQVKADKT